MVVPLLPHYHMGEMYEELLKKNFNFRHDPHYRNFRKFKQYVKSYWATKNFKELSVFGMDRRTNNNCESFHAQYNALVSEKHPSLYDFASYTNEMFENYRMDFDRLLNNPEVPITRARRAGLDRRDARLKQLERLLLDGQMTPMEFLENNMNSADGIIERAIGPEIENYDEIDDQDDGIIEDEDIVRRVMINRGSCLSCEEFCNEKFVLSCGDEKFCNDCSQMAIQNSKCPICDQNVTNRIKLK